MQMNDISLPPVDCLVIYPRGPLHGNVCNCMDNFRLTVSSDGTSTKRIENICAGEAVQSKRLSSW